MRFAELQHRADEVAAVDAEHPRDADDEELIRLLGGAELAEVFALAVFVYRRFRTVGREGLAALPVVNVVSADIDQLGVDGFAGAGDIAGAFGVDGEAELRRLLRLVDGGERRAVDDRVRRVGGDVVRYLLRLREVEVVDVDALRFYAALFKLYDDVVAELTLDAGY